MALEPRVLEDSFFPFLHETLEGEDILEVFTPNTAQGVKVQAEGGLGELAVAPQNYGTPLIGQGSKWRS